MRARPVTMLATLPSIVALLPASGMAIDEGHALDVGPEFALRAVAPAGEHVLSARMWGGPAYSSVDGFRILFTIESGPDASSATLSCVTDGEGRCSTAYTGSGGAGTDRIRAWVEGEEMSPDPDEGPDQEEIPGASSELDATDVVEVGWTEGLIPHLEVEPEFVWRAKGPVRFTATVSDQFGQPMEANVDFTGGYSGTDSSEVECQTDASGSCQVLYPPETGSRRPSWFGDVPIRLWAWVDHDGDNRARDEADESERENEDGGAGDLEEPDHTDLVSIFFTGCLRGTADDDLIVGSHLDDCMKGLEGDDVLRGGDGDDRGSGGAGDDVLRGGAGHDVLTGGEGRDRVIGGRHRDYCSGEIQRSCETGPRQA